MFFLTLKESVEWYRALGRNLNDLPTPLPSDVTEAFSMNIERENPDQVGRALTRLALGSAIESGSRLLLVTETGTWPSSEDWYLYYTLRQANGDNKPLHEAPGHRFLAHEAPAFRSWLCLALRFGWGGHVAGSCDSIAYMFDHDGNMLVVNYGNSGDIEKYLGHLNLEMSKREV